MKQEIKWRFFYFFLTYFFTFVCCIDSWEYLFVFEISFLKKIDVQLTNFIFSKITDGQFLIYFLSAYYAVLISIPFLFFQIFLFFFPGLFRKEIEVFLFLFFLFYLSFLVGIAMNQFCFFPFICKDLLQYQYSALNDRMLNVKVEYLINIKDILQLKVRTSLFSGFLFCLPLFLYISSRILKIIFFLFIKYRTFFYFFLFFYMLYFYEGDFYILFFFFIINFVLFEGSFFFVCLGVR